MPFVSRLSATPLKGTALHSPATVPLIDERVADNRRSHLIDARGRLLHGEQHGPRSGWTAELEASGGQLTTRFPERAPVTGTAAASGDAT